MIKKLWSMVRETFILLGSGRAIVFIVYWNDISRKCWFVCLFSFDYYKKINLSTIKGNGI